jgi:hypothetical protein
MPYWLTNPDHGTMPVYDMGEVERVKKFGWTLLNQGESPILVPVINGDATREPEDVIEEQEAPEIVALPVVSEPPKRKPGRPPKAK